MSRRAHTDSEGRSLRPHSANASSTHRSREYTMQAVLSPRSNSLGAPLVAPVEPVKATPAAVQTFTAAHRNVLGVAAPGTHDSPYNYVNLPFMPAPVIVASSGASSSASLDRRSELRYRSNTNLVNGDCGQGPASESGQGSGPVVGGASVLRPSRSMTSHPSANSLVAAFGSPEASPESPMMSPAIEPNFFRLSHNPLPPDR